MYIHYSSLNNLSLHINKGVLHIHVDLCIEFLLHVHVCYIRESVDSLCRDDTVTPIA